LDQTKHYSTNNSFQQTKYLVDLKYIQQLALLDMIFCIYI